MRLTTSQFIRHSLLLALFTTAAHAAERGAIGDDGREILLKDNGTWEYKNEDRFATTETGSRVRLKDNGSWEFIENKEVATPKVYSESNLNIELGDVIIHTEKSPIPNSNNFRIETQTEILLNVIVSEVSKMPVEANISDTSLVSVTDNRGKSYKVIALKAPQKTLQPGNSYPFAIMVDGAPKHSFFSLSGQIKSLTIELDKAVFGTNSSFELNYSTDKMREIVNGEEVEK